MLERGPRIMSREDDDVAEEAARILTGEGIEIRNNVQIESVSPKDGVTVTAKIGDRKHNITGSHILLATGRVPVYTMFIDPPMGRVGMSETQAKKSGRKVLKGSIPMSSINRAREKDETGGLVKVLVDAKTGQLLGAAVFGTGGDEVINIFATWMYTRLPYTEFRKAVIVHPTVSELMPYVFDNLEPVG